MVVRRPLMRCLLWCAGLEVDAVNERLWWVNSDSGTVAWCGIDGSAAGVSSQFKVSSTRTHFFVAC